MVEHREKDTIRSYKKGGQKNPWAEDFTGHERRTKRHDTRKQEGTGNNKFGVSAKVLSQVNGRKIKEKPQEIAK